MSIQGSTEQCSTEQFSSFTQQFPRTQGILGKDAPLPIQLVLEILKYSCNSPNMFNKLRCINKCITTIVELPSFKVDVLNRLAPVGRAELSVLATVKEGFTPESFAAAHALLAERWDLFNRVCKIWIRSQEDIKEIPTEWHFAIAQKKLLPTSHHDLYGAELLINNGTLSKDELKKLGACAASRNEWDIVELIMGKGVDLSDLQMKVLQWPHFLENPDKVCKMIDEGIVSPKAMIIQRGTKRPLLDLAIELKNNTKLASELLDRGCPQVFINPKGNLDWLFTELNTFRLDNKMKELLISRAYGQPWLSKFKDEINCILFVKAAEDPTSSSIKKLIRLGADINLVNLSHGMTILAGAAVYHGLEGLEMLREQGAQLITEDPNSLKGLAQLVNEFPEETLRTLFKEVPQEYFTFTPEIFEMAVKDLGGYSIQTLEKWHTIGLPIQVGDKTVLQIFSDKDSRILDEFRTPIPKGKLRQDLIRQLEGVGTDGEPLKARISTNGSRSQYIFQGLGYPTTQREESPSRKRSQKEPEEREQYVKDLFAKILAGK